MNHQPKYHSYLVRLWLVEEVSETPFWHGELVHIQSGQKYSFERLTQLLRFLQAGFAQEAWFDDES